MNEVIARVVLSDSSRMFLPQYSRNPSRILVVFIDSEDYFAIKLIKSAAYRLGTDYALRIYHTSEVSNYVWNQVESWGCVQVSQIEKPVHEILNMPTFWRSLAPSERALIMPRPSFVFRDPFTLDAAAPFIGSKSGGTMLVSVKEAEALCLEPPSSPGASFHERMDAKFPCPVSPFDGAFGIDRLSMRSSDVRERIADLRI
jgi:hypothetical protein